MARVSEVIPGSKSNYVDDCFQTKQYGEYKTNVLQNTFVCFGLAFVVYTQHN